MHLLEASGPLIKDLQRVLIRRINTKARWQLDNNFQADKLFLTCRTLLRKLKARREERHLEGQVIPPV
jgi:hypothetical protein